MSDTDPRYPAGDLAAGPEARGAPTEKGRPPQWEAHPCNAAATAHRAPLAVPSRGERLFRKELLFSTPKLKKHVRQPNQSTTVTIYSFEGGRSARHSDGNSNASTDQGRRYITLAPIFPSGTMHMGFLWPLEPPPLLLRPSCSCFRHRWLILQAVPPAKKEKHKHSLLLQSFSQDHPCLNQFFERFLGWVTTDAEVLSGFGSPKGSKQASKGKGQRGNCGGYDFAKQTVRSHGISIKNAFYLVAHIFKN